MREDEGCQYRAGRLHLCIRREEAIEPARHARERTLGQPHDLGGDGHCDVEAHQVQLRAPRLAKALDEAIAQSLHQCAIVAADDLGREEPRDGPALFLVRFAPLIEDGGMLAPAETFQQLGPETRLLYAVAAENLARKAQFFHDNRAGRRLRRARRFPLIPALVVWADGSEMGVDHGAPIYDPYWIITNRSRFGNPAPIRTGIRNA